jgi:hypothetical protein
MAYVTDDSDSDESQAPSGDYDWHSPRWRDSDSVQGDVERDRRLRSPKAPRQRGAIDQGGSVDPSAERRRGSGQAKTPNERDGNRR